ncbi:hypothetical protein FSP39_001162 [Pinctada imbricata]|uniref:JmjC domain-containing protein n=1 Tax=Pinctada imbricata TaxID=66713 RepID=A0AA88Y0W4_PINIB|nr:hypothetical protein FSP39_001162 [Pinctada imbricata]
MFPMMDHTSHLVLIFLTIFTSTLAKVGFPKDQNMDAHTFPPFIERASSGIPDGHLRPLGFQKRSSGKISETLEMPSPHMFYIKYIKANIPVLIHEAYRDLPLYKKWEDDSYLKEKFGSLNVSVTVKRQMVKHTSHTMTLKKFLLDYVHEEWYLASAVPMEMMAELPFPSSLRCGTFSKRLQEAELWMSSGGTSSLLHSHEDHNLHCVLFGRKDFIIIDEKYKNNFDFKEKYFHAGAGHSPLNMDMVNMFKYSNIKHTPWNHATLRQGDCLFLPAGYLHQVRSYGRGISFTVLFSPSNEFDSSDCSRKDKDVKKADSSLADAEFVWAYRNGSHELYHDKMEPNILQNLLQLLMRSKHEIYREQFEHFFDAAVDKFPEHMEASEVFSQLTQGLGHDYLTKKDIDRLSTSRLLRICKIFNDGGKKFKKSKDEL